MYFQERTVTASQWNPSFESGKWLKVKVVNWCWKSYIESVSLNKRETATLSDEW